MAFSSILKIGSRKSHLARYQAYLVGLALKRAQPGLEVEFFFKESLGDVNLTDPLWKMPEKGVFTEDFIQDLESHRVDLVVHSWKDLPTAQRKSTQIVGTLLRAETRDLLLVKKSSRGLKEWKILCSSPRRQRNLGLELTPLLPAPAPSLKFESVRGNIPTRIRKLIEGEGDALVLAKAALDRLLGWRELSDILPQSEKDDFSELENLLRMQLQHCDWMILPVQLNPPAAAQGALAIDVSVTASPELLDLIAKINCRKTFADVSRERSILAGYGGGCHQAIGVWCKQIKGGQLESLKGKTDAGEELNSWEFRSPGVASPRSAAIFPRNMSTDALTESVTLGEITIPDSRDLWIAKHKALPESFRPTTGQVLWTAGLESWKKLAARGLWIHGSSESTGIEMDSRLDFLLGRSPHFLRLTHLDAVAGPDDLGTYQIRLKTNLPDLSQVEHFFWTSGSVFKWITEREPQLLKARHSCGLGKTADQLRKLLPASNPPTLFTSYESWKRNLSL